MVDVWIRLINKTYEDNNSLEVRHIYSWHLDCKGKCTYKSINVMLAAGGRDHNHCRMPGPEGVKYGSA